MPFLGAYRTLQRHAHESPVIFFSCVIGLTGPAMMLVVPPIRERLGYKPSPPIPNSYPRTSPATTESSARLRRRIDDLAGLQWDEIERCGGDSLGVPIQNCRLPESNLTVLLHGRAANLAVQNLRVMRSSMNLVTLTARIHVSG
ncbi:unnamed protein product [Mycena citricolor]|uniref:Uncharacterized protein n=1 Tax=Mycena citricolor TaxID=2018698 RepID=A0AAD2JYJ9_9AGAR|nr:unnamed protein product [Mycena citricolor]